MAVAGAASVVMGLPDSSSAGGMSELGLPAGSGPLVDVNVWLDRWPGRRVPLDETAKLVSALRKRGVTRAWAGSFASLLHKDQGGVNARLAAECRCHGKDVLLPFGSINPLLSGWEEEMRRCGEDYKMPGIRLAPNYHGYKLSDPVFAQLLDVAVRRGLVVQIAVMMEDERMQHPLMKAAHVDVAPLTDLLKERPSVKVVLLNWARGVSLNYAAKLAKAGQVWFEIATVEGVGGVDNLLAVVPEARVLFGSYAPLFYFESAALKLKESPLAPAQLAAVRSGNARKILA
jgi:predicted TIM-barrel fold metal-dependent hydrolase